MNWSMVSALSSILGPILVGVFLSGKFTQRMTNNERRIEEVDTGSRQRVEKVDKRVDEVDERVDGHALKLGEHDVAIAAQLAWRDGFDKGRASAPHGR